MASEKWRAAMFRGRIRAFNQGMLACMSGGIAQATCSPYYTSNKALHAAWCRGFWWVWRSQKEQA